ncbi:MAG TPA: farnesyl diphosphate synthase [Candidatus Acidoferrum sp.]|nr:farnesyl diphosphate synthase [Candidatus Acidoferrum sp.]
MDFELWLQQRRQRAEQALTQTLTHAAAEPKLADAMRYAVLGGGKRLRPLLAYAAAEAVGKVTAATDAVACAVESIHAYSLVHDDLPAMDDDVLRRGQPTCHVKFGEAAAILAGDALQTLAFEILATAPLPDCSDQVRLQMLRELAIASGRDGMVAGQALDMAATGEQPGEARLGRMHRLKTGALIVASVVLGALSTGIASAGQLTALRHFAEAAGLAFQIRDDILDVEASTATTGKEQGKDQRQHKATYVSILGLAAAKARLAQVADAALAALAELGPAAEPLRLLARHLVERSA